MPHLTRDILLMSGMLPIGFQAPCSYLAGWWYVCQKDHNFLICNVKWELVDKASAVMAYYCGLGFCLVSSNVLQMLMVLLLLLLCKCRCHVFWLVLCNMDMCTHVRIYGFLFVSPMIFPCWYHVCQYWGLLLCQILSASDGTWCIVILHLL